MYASGTSNGRPSNVSLDAHTTLRMPAAQAAAKTLYEVITLFVNVVEFVVSPGAGPPDWFGAKPADGPRHPVVDMDAASCTQQLGVAGPWNERLPSFQLERYVHGKS